VTTLPPVDPVALGATLYLPATRRDLAAVLLGGRWPTLRSAVVCLEDSIRADEVGLALVNLRKLVGTLPGQAAPATLPLIFVRPRDAAMLARILTFRGIEHVAGFVLPKATADSLPDYMAALAFDHHLLMPTLETREVFDPAEMRRLREQLLAIRDRVLALRIGGNDLFQQLGTRRSASRTAYDGPLGPVIAGLVGTFAPWGFALSAPVFEAFGNPALLREEVLRDIDHGLLTKTAIHPAQIDPIQDLYAVAAGDVVEARTMLDAATGAVFARNGAMCEPATHRRWAETIVRRAETFGVVRDETMTLIA
jgi:citrate lyase beta subunit